MSRVNRRLRQMFGWLVVIPSLFIGRIMNSIWVPLAVGVLLALEYWWTTRESRHQEAEEREVGSRQPVMMSGRRRLFSKGEIPQAQPQRIWLPPLDFRIVFPLLAIAFVAALFYPFHDIDPLLEDPVTVTAMSLGCLYVAIVPFRNRLELHPDALYVWTLTRVRRLPIVDVADVRSGDNGLDVTMRDGRVVTTWLIGEKVRPHRKRRTRADRMADEVRALVVR